MFKKITLVIWKFQNFKNLCDLYNLREDMVTILEHGFEIETIKIS